MRSSLPLVALLTLALSAAAPIRAQDSSLPDIGSSAGEILSPEQETEYGEYTLYELRNMGLVLEDPLVDSWLDGMGYRLVASSAIPKQHFTFFMLRDRDINAFATLGGFVAVNSGLVLTAEREDEVAGVLAHEISHVSQRHVLRAVERARKDQLPIMLAMLGAIVAAQSSKNQDVGTATQAVLVGGQALMVQRQIDYTRDNEAEADRIGITTLYRAGYDPEAMGDFFERMQRATRGNSGGYRLPDYLQSHPVTTTRISEARERAQRLESQGSTSRPDLPSAAASPLLPTAFSSTASVRTRDLANTGNFPWARERLRVLSASSPSAAVNEYKAMADAPGARLTDAQRYGQALAQMQAGYPAATESGIQDLLTRHPGDRWLELTLAEAAHVQKKDALSRDRFEALVKHYPNDRAVTLTYTRVLGEIGTPESGRRAQALLRPLLADGGEDPVFQRNFARACELAGDIVRAGESYAEVAFLNGRAEDALNQLDGLLKRDDLDYYQRARIEARIAAITPIVLDMRRQGLKPENQPVERG